MLQCSGGREGNGKQVSTQGGERVSGDNRWYVARTNRSREQLAEEHLNRQAFRTFLPVLPRTRRRNGKFHTRLAPVFPGYIFVNLDLERDRWHSVNGTFGVGYLIASGDRPTPVPPGVVEVLKVAFDTSNLREEPLPAFTVGDKVELTTGPFANMVGELLETSSGGRVKILLEVMGRETPIWTVAKGVLPAA